MYSDLVTFNKEGLEHWFKENPTWINEKVSESYTMTPLAWAAQRGNVELIEFLLNLGADING